ncbi:hypothetical protein E0Z06_12200 [Rheinheimera sp. D18]|uniref:hypothetical protein n=1 Tax=Rheinheimera sp. D18 TaxID=2545632 RepID=UPI00104C779D|nr:hypothetical protein [Rheinheimera sp. D18]QBL10229.1 hypothetical protein E0Z06_12200 [Rheinheimera sp. D18]
MTVPGLSFNNLQLQYQALKLDDASLQRQNVADQVAAPATLKHAEPKQPKPNVNNENQSAFLAQLMEQMLANRIGLDKQKYDEITKKIEETQQQIDTLSEQPASPAKDKQLSILEQKLEQLNDALESLVEQANRNREQKERTELAAKDLLEQYHSPAAAQRVKNSFFV